MYLLITPHYCQFPPDRKAVLEDVLHQIRLLQVLSNKPGENPFVRKVPLKVRLIS